jgi:hypothetical protein
MFSKMKKGVATSVEEITKWHEKAMSGQMFLQTSTADGLEDVPYTSRTGAAQNITRRSAKLAHLAGSVTRIRCFTSIHDASLTIAKLRLRGIKKGNRSKYNFVLYVKERQEKLHKVQ